MKIVNIGARVRIDVTKEDIKNARNPKSKNCPIGLAFSRKFDSKNVSAGRASVDVNVNGINEVFALPSEAIEITRLWDAYYHMEPSCFYARRVE